MKQFAWLAGAVFAAMAAAQAVETVDAFKPLKAAEYIIYSGDVINEPEPPSKKDRKLSIVFQGKPAKEIFDEIGPDLPMRQACSQTRGDRERRKGGVECRYTSGDKPGNGSYQCWVGMDLKTGQSHATVGC